MYRYIDTYMCVACRLLVDQRVCACACARACVSVVVVVCIGVVVEISTRAQSGCVLCVELIVNPN